MPLTKDSLVRGYQFDGATGLHSGEQLEDLVTRATPAEGSEIVDQSTLETYLDEILNIHRLRIKDGGITGDKIADGAITNDHLSEGFTMIKSVQRSAVPLFVEHNKDTDVTITAVDLNKAFLVFSSANGNGSGDVNAQLINSTTIRFHNYAATGDEWAHWQVIEFV